MTRKRRAGVARQLPGLLAALMLVGCQSMWANLRESERGYAQTRARELARAGDCADALRSLERSQASLDLGHYGAESTFLKARCLERLGRTEEALAHLRMLVDFYPESPYVARIDSGRREDFEATRTSARAGAPPAALRVPKVRYEPHAGRSRVTGRVHLEYVINRKGTTERIRVVSTEHPMLASWAIEALASADVRGVDLPRLNLPVAGASAFDFQTYWTYGEQVAAAEADGEAPTGTEEGDAPEDDDGWEWEWLIP